MRPWKQAIYELELKVNSCRAIDIEGLLSNQKEKLQQLVKRATTNALPTNTKRKTETQESRKDMNTLGLFELHW